MAKKKLGILTFHTANIFGAVWQAYALKKLCEDLGYDVYFILDLIIQYIINL